MKPLMSLCSIPKVATRDGWAGSVAKILLPFYGYWFASGATYTFPGGTVGQDQSQIVSGRTMADTFQKDASVTCLGH